MSDLDKAVESGELKRVINGMDIAGIHPSLKLLCAAARRFLALTETGPDYEAAAKRLYEHEGHGMDFDKLAAEMLDEDGLDLLADYARDVRPIVDAALADYLTEEDR